MKRDEVLKEFKETFGVELPADVATIVAILVDTARLQALEDAASIANRMARVQEDAIERTVSATARLTAHHSMDTADLIAKHIRELAKEYA